MIEETFSYDRIEDISRFFAASCGGACGFAISVKGKHLKHAVEQNTITKTLELGRKIREAREQGQTPIKTLTDMPDTYLIFKGEVTHVDITPRFAYESGEIKIRGSEDFTGKTLKVWVKNENLVTWINEDPYVTAPDHIVLSHPETAEGLGNHDLVIGTKVLVIGKKSHEIWRSKGGLEVFSPRHFGFNIDYKPIEKFF